MNSVITREEYLDDDIVRSISSLMTHEPKQTPLFL